MRKYWLCVVQKLVDRVFGTPGEWSLTQCRTAKCQLIWLNPCPREDQIYRAYETYYTHEQTNPAEDRSISFTILRRIYRSIREDYIRVRFGYAPTATSFVLAPLAFLNPAGTDTFDVDAMFLPWPGNNNRLLEIGCGEGSSLERMRLRGWNVEGIESDPACVSLVKQRGIMCSKGDIRDVQFEPGSYHAIFMGNVIEHVYDPADFLAECYRILRPGGSIVIVTPNSRSWGHERFGKDWRGLEPPRHLQLFNSTNIVDMAKRVGLISPTVLYNKPRYLVYSRDE